MSDARGAASEGGEGRMQQCEASDAVGEAKQGAGPDMPLLLVSGHLYGSIYSSMYGSIYIVVHD